VTGSEVLSVSSGNEALGSLASPSLFEQLEYLGFAGASQVDAHAPELLPHYSSSNAAG
jgi:hypothetical protein